MAQMLRLAGMRADVPPDRRDRVRQAVLDECRAVARARAVRRRAVTAMALLSAAAIAVFAVRLVSRHEAPPPGATPVASVAALEGNGARVRGSTGPRATPIRLAGAVQAGDRIEVDAAGRIGLQLSNGVSVRLDSGSEVVLSSATAIELAAGAVYVDSGSESPAVELHTPFGIVRDVGTQFEVRLAASSLRVRVRSGLVEVHRGARVHTARPGLELSVDAGRVTSRVSAPYGPEWAWVAGLAPPFDIEGRSLGGFLAHLCREQGWTLTYVDATLEREAARIFLHGSTEGLPPSDALAVVLASTGLTHRFKDGELVVLRTADR